MSFHDDASFVFLAAGEAAKDTDDGGKLYNLKPAEELSSTELVINGDFSIDGPGANGELGTAFGSFGWNTIAPNEDQNQQEGTSTIANGILTLTNGAGDVDARAYVTDGVSTRNVVTINTYYRVTYTVVENTNCTSFRVYHQGGQFVPAPGTVGTHTLIVRNTQNQLFLFTNSTESSSISIDQVSLREITTQSKDFDYVRGDDLNQSRIGEGGQVEVGRQNLLEYSNKFDESGSWNKTGTLTSGFKGYDGTNSGWKLTSGISSALLEQTATANALITGATGRVRTFSFYAKEGSVDGVVCRVSRVATPVQVEFYADLSNGTFRSGENPGGDRIGSRIEDAGNGWYRFSITFKIQITNVRIYAAKLNESNQNTVNVGSNQFIYVQNAQLETGFGATSYIPTTASSATVGVKEDEPRFSYPPMGGKPHLLLEPQRINRVKYSEYLDDSNWKFSAGEPPVTGVTVTHQAGKAPDGSNRAILVKEVGTINDEHQIRQVFPYNENEVYSHSFFAKPAGRTKIRLRYGTATVSNHFAEFTLVGTGTVSATAGNTTTNASGLSVKNSGEGKASIEEHRDGWYRCKIENVIGQNLDTEDNHNDGSSTNSNFMFMKDDLVTYVGDENLGMYLWGFQNEVGDYCSSYIPNHEAVATTTRTADAPTHLDTGISHGTDCSFFLEGKMLGQDAQVSLLTLSPNNTGDGTKRLLFFTDTSTNPNAGTHRIVVQNKSGTETVALYGTSGGLNIGETFKVVVNYSGTKMQAWLNGEYMNSLSDMSGNNFHTITADDHFGRIDLSRDQTQNSHGISKILTFSDTMSRNDSEIITGTNYDTVSQMAEALTYDYHD